MTRTFLILKQHLIFLIISYPDFTSAKQKGGSGILVISTSLEFILDSAGAIVINEWYVDGKRINLHMVRDGFAWNDSIITRSRISGDIAEEQ